MLRHIDTLPGAERHFSADDRHVKTDAVKHRLDVRRHIVRPFNLVHPSVARRRDALKRADKIALHIRIGIFLDDERSRSVFEMKQHNTIPRLGLFEKTRNFARDFEKSFAGSRYHELDRRDACHRGNVDRRKIAQNTPRRSALVQHLLLRPRNCFNEPMPHPADEGHRAIDIGVVG